jgi:hypothetical protein
MDHPKKAVRRHTRPLSKRFRIEEVMRPNPVLLSRGQLAWVIAWHILLPTFAIGLASF